MATERPHWHAEAELYVPLWGNRQPLPFDNVIVPIFDSKGRPILETARPNPAGVLFEYASGPRDGGREGKFVNRSAFADVAHHYPEATGLLSHLRSSILPYDHTADPGQIEEVIDTAVGLPFWLIHKADDPVRNGEIPPYIAAATKIARGFLLPFDARHISHVMASVGERLPAPPQSILSGTDTFVDYILENHYLVKQNIHGETDHACPAPTEMIRGVTRVLFERPTTNHEAVGEKLGLSREDLLRARDFGRAMAEASLVDEIYKTLYPDPADTQSSFNAFLAERTIFGDLSEEALHKRKLGAIYLQTMNRTQQIMNRALGREVPQPMISEDVI